MQRNAEFDEEYLNRRSKKLSMIKQITDDADMINNVDSVAFNQEDLLDALDLGKKSIYLVQGDFTVPLSVADITYIGIDNPAMVAKIKECRKLMEGSEDTPGISFSESLAKAGIFSAMYSKMVNIGFKSGSVDKVFKKIADSYDEEIDNSMSNMISILEPTLVIILSIVVCLILLSVIMPLMGIMSSIG